MTRLEITRTLAAPPERVWRAFTDPAALNGWFWPHLDGRAEVDLRVGGGYRIVGPKAGIEVAGEYLEIDPPKRLVFTWRWGEEEERSLVTLEVTVAAGGTLLSIVHDQFADPTSRDAHHQGWNDCLDRLPDWLAMR